MSGLCRFTAFGDDANLQRGGPVLQPGDYTQMTANFRFHFVLFMFASAALNQQQGALAAPPAAPSRLTNVQRAAPIFRDVALDSRGTVCGHISTADTDSPSVPAEIVFYRDGKLICEAISDQNGSFYSPPIPSGTYEIRARTCQGSQPPMRVRVWAHGTAPPAAEEQLVIPVDKQPVHRGQDDRPLIIRTIFRNPWITATVIGAAIALPIALTYERDTSP